MAKTASRAAPPPNVSPPLPDLEQLRGLRAFVAAAQSLSFTRAAAEQGVTPQAISGAVARLEAALGTRLFNRSTRSMALTEEGARLLPQACDALSRLREAVQGVAAGADPHSPAGVVRISVAGGFARHYVLPELPALAQRYPRIRIELAMDARKVDMVREGFDVVIRGGVFADASVISRRVCTLTWVLVASPAYLAAAGVPNRPGDLLAHRLISLRFLSGVTSEWTFREPGRPRSNRAAAGVTTLQPQGTITVSDPESVAQAAALGLGIGAVSLHHAMPYLRAGQLKVLLLDSFAPVAREIAIQYPHREHLAPRVRVVVSHLIAAFEASEDLHRTLKDAKAFAAV